MYYPIWQLQKSVDYSYTKTQPHCGGAECNTLVKNKCATGTRPLPINRVQREPLPRMTVPLRSRVRPLESPKVAGQVDWAAHSPAHIGPLPPCQPRRFPFRSRLRINSGTLSFLHQRRGIKATCPHSSFEISNQIVCVTQLHLKSTQTHKRTPKRCSLSCVVLQQAIRPLQYAWLGN